MKRKGDNDIIKLALNNIEGDYVYMRKNRNSAGLSGGPSIWGKIFGPIGRFFVAVWRWIRETAWVQPLLIVGVIFGVIFSIPSIVDGIRGISDRHNSPDTFYKKYQVSLKGAEESDAQKLVKDIYDELNNPGSTTLADDKFLIAFVQSDNKCGACDTARDGFEYLMENENVLNPDGAPFKLKTIFTDEELKRRDDEDWKKEDTVVEDNEAKSAFEAFLTRNAVYDYFSEIADSASKSGYYNSGNFDFQDDFLEFLTVPNKFKTPTLIQVDFTSADSDTYIEGSNPITVFFGIEGDGKIGQADYIADAWNYKNDFKPL